MSRHIILFFSLVLLFIPSVSSKASDASRIETIHQKAKYAVYHDKSDSAITYNKQMITLAGQSSVDKHTKHHYTAMGYNNIAFIYMFYKNDYQKAIKFLMNANNVVEPDDYEILTSIDQNFGHIYSFYAGCFPTETNISAAQDYYRLAFHTAMKAHRWNNVINSFPNLFNFGLDEATLKKFRNEIDEFGKAPIPPSTPLYHEMHLFYEALCCLQKGNHQGALDILRTLERIPADNDINYRDNCFAIWNEAQVFKAIHQPDSVYNCCMKLIKLTDEHPELKDVRIDTYRLLFQYFEAKGNNAEAQSYKNKYYELRDSLLVDKNLNNVQSTFLMGNIDNLKGQVDLLEEQRQMQWIIILLAVIVIILGVVLVVVQRRKNRLLESRNKLLYVKMQELIGDTEKPKYKGSKLEEPTKGILQEKIQSVLSSSDDIYNEDFSLEQLSRLVDASYHDVSQVINERFHQSFTNLLSQYRIMEACRRMNDFEHYGQFTIEAIGLSVGFKNRSSFSRAFKRVTQLTPSEYYKEARNSENATK